MIAYAPGLVLIALLSRIDGSLQATCDDNEFTCGDGTCLDSFLACDGEKNCPDGSDETKPLCSKMNLVCQPFAFRCDYGACIDGDLRCDGKADCADGSDERNPGCGTALTVNTTSNCQVGQFSCKSGQCINEWLICDGEENCRDGSDETETLCINFPCPPIIGFQCKYGGCIDKDRKCNGVKDCKDGSDEDPLACISDLPVKPTTSGQGGHSSTKGCKLPLYPEGGSFTVADCEDRTSAKCRGTPGVVVEPNTYIVYSCWEGYRLSSKDNRSLCFQESWYPELPTCLKLCKPLISDSLDISCSYKDAPVNCSQEVIPGTKAKPKCKPLYRFHGYPTGGDPICGDNGLWTEPLFRCKPECGIRTSDKAVPLVSYGVATSALEYPWYSGLYRFDTEVNDFELFCGGSIISPYTILTAAHCLVINTDVLEASKIRVVVGKTHRKWSYQEPSEQRFTVSKVIVHPSYRGNDFSYAFDIGILELQGHIVIGRVSMPICMETIPPWTVLPNAAIGTVVGFGRNENNELNEQLMAVNLTYTDHAQCKRRAPSNFKTYVSPDKFCGKFKDGAGVQQGDSGGGYVFLKPEINFYFIRGIVSTKPTDRNVFATFTNISEKSHFDFIRESLNEIATRRNN